MENEQGPIAQYALSGGSLHERPLAVLSDTFCWAILPTALGRIAGRPMAYVAETRVRYEAAMARPVGGGVAVVPIVGPIFYRGGFLTELFGFGTVQSIQANLRAALADPEVGAIILDVDSPGGTVDGVPELAEEILAARDRKRIIAVADTQAASAAYWIASQASELVVAPSGEVGSIGVFAAHEDISEALGTAGVKITLISAGKYKVEESPFAPLTDEARGYIQSRVDEYYEAFVKAVSKGRGVSPNEVRSGFGQGRMLGAKMAVAAGMADRIGTLDDTIHRMMGARAKSGIAAELPGSTDDLDLRQRRSRLKRREADGA